VAGQPVGAWPIEACAIEAWAIVLAAGGGSRFGGPKQFADLGGEPMLAHPVRAAREVCHGVVVVLPPALIDRWDPPAGVRVVGGGANRAESVRAGLAAVPPTAGVVVVTDAAHPLATPSLYRSVVDTVRAGADAAVPGLPLTEVVKEVVVKEVSDGGTEVGAPLVAGRSLPRETHRLVQTPHAFRADLLRAAHAGAPAAVEDSAMVAERGATVVVVPGEPANLHVTTPEELTMARLLLPGVLTGGGVA
jgi:2-C-methyl-D-erythritol 4-phosphate cytidylyltransferase